MEQPELSKRFDFHPADTEAKRNHHEDVRAEFRNVAAVLNRLLPEGREKACAFTALEESMFWSNAAVARNESPDTE